MGSETGAEQEIGKIIERVSISTANVDKLAKLVQELLEKEKENTGNVQKQVIIHEGPGGWLAGLLIGALVACFATWFGLFMLHAELQSVKAWTDKHTSEIAVLKDRGR